MTTLESATELESVESSAIAIQPTKSYPQSDGDLAQKLEITSLEANTKEEAGILTFVSIIAISFVSVMALVLCSFEIFD